MTTISLGDMAQAFAMRRQTAGLKGQSQAAAQEVATGVAADKAAHLGGDLTPLTGIAASLAGLSGYAAATRDATLQTTAQQSVLATIGTLSGDLTQGFVTFGIEGDPTLLDARLAQSDQAFAAAVGALNTQVGGASVMAGQAPGGPAVASAETILTALQAAITDAGAVTAADVDNVVTGWFADPAGFASLGYLGGDPQAPVAISPGETSDRSLTANDPVLRDSLRNLALGALMHRGVLQAPAERQSLAHRIGTAMLQNDGDRVHLQGTLGLTQGQIERVSTRNASEKSALELQRSDLLGVDGYEAATKLEAAQSQLETLYAITARLSRLNLVDFLR